ncbi:MAG: hypothetical protein JWP31_2739, partial [Aeromicrobium sp.]|nr:hypothetical protein [Aeromicrobium sp.]
GTFSVIDPAVENGKRTGEYNATFGIVTEDMTPTCTYAASGGDASGYRQRRPEGVISDRDFSTGVDCKVKPNQIDRQVSKSVLKRSAASPAMIEGTTATGKASWKWLLSDPVNR